MITQIRNWTAFAVSVAALFWLQPASAVRNLDFWLPIASITIAAVIWAWTLPPSGAPTRRESTIDVIVLALIVCAIGALRYVPALSTLLTRTRPPDITAILPALLVAIALCAGVSRIRSGRAWAVAVGLLIALLLLQKFTPTSEAASAALRTLQGQSAAQATALDWRWLGFSYIAFRLMSVLRDRAQGRLPAMRLREFMTYAVFAPALPAGPIDRPDRFLRDLRSPYTPGLALILEAGERLLIGAFKKFALADTLALVALSDANAMHLRVGWAWLPVYAYALRIYFDFSGYTDMALGVARLFGVRLPENFAAPYFKPNLTQFWNSWHMSLSQWFRAYWFNPLTRALRIRKWEPAPIVLLGQVTTMMFIALWHGVAANFALWGVWHSVGLFVHNRWADFARGRLAFVSERERLQRAVNVIGAALTFHFVALGWVWFALSSPAAALHVLRALLFLP
jgi:alginate O-acetyltransferase complex protein AlgI